MRLDPLPPGPALPSTVQLLAWLYRPARFFEYCLARYGEIFTMRLPGQAPRVMLARHEAIRDVFTGDPALLHAGAANALVAPLVGPRSVLILDGVAHQRQRRLLLSSFAARRVATWCAVMRELTEEALADWPVGVERPLHPALQTLTLRIIAATIFGVQGGARLRSLLQLLDALLTEAQDPLLLVPALRRDLGPLTHWRRFVARKRALDDLLRPLFAERRARGTSADADAGDVLGHLLGAQDEAGRPLSDEQLRDELVTLLVAGHETTASALAWTLSEVLARPEVRARAQEELAAVTGGAPIAHEHLERLAYLDAVVHEALRLHPVLGHIGRQLAAPLRVGGHELPAGCMVVPCVYLAHQDPRIFPEPQRFRPERFLVSRFAPAAYLPFGGGARRCIGMTFALQEMKVVLATLLQRAEFALRPGPAPRIGRRGVVWTPVGGVPARRLRPASPTTGEA